MFCTQFATSGAHTVNQSGREMSDRVKQIEVISGLIGGERVVVCSKTRWVAVTFEL